VLQQRLSAGGVNDGEATPEKTEIASTTPRSAIVRGAVAGASLSLDETAGSELHSLSL
jgi:hypothetical protein